MAEPTREQFREAFGWTLRERGINLDRQYIDALARVATVVVERAGADEPTETQADLERTWEAVGAARREAVAVAEVALAQSAQYGAATACIAPHLLRTLVDAIPEASDG